jgi:methylated-DNA-[protein]-cysteine S-methyltransferase
MIRARLETPVGPLVIGAEGEAVVALEWGGCAEEAEETAEKREAERSPVLAAARAALEAYFAGRSGRFALPLAPRGTAFQLRVWQALRTIPPGEVLTYGALARRLGTSPRAVGQANAANPLPIFIPCHRVVAESGLGGYSGGGGLATKSWLLEHERRHFAPFLPGRAPGGGEERPEA